MATFFATESIYIIHKCNFYLLYPRGIPGFFSRCSVHGNLLFLLFQIMAFINKHALSQLSSKLATRRAAQAKNEQDNSAYSHQGSDDYDYSADYLSVFKKPSQWMHFFLTPSSLYDCQFLQW
jgi:hypothetical protein